MPRRFPPPWTVTRTTGGWCVNDASGHPVAYVYGEERPQGASSRAMTVDEARKIAVNIARLPDLLNAQRAQPDA
jgi:hypothetical protein